MFETNEELLMQLALGEDSTFELKELRFKNNRIADPHRQSMSDELAAMANSNSGVFLLGVDDNTKNVIGIPLDRLDIVETWIRGICNDLIVPPLLCKIRKIFLLGIDGELKPVIRLDIDKSLYVHKSSSGYYHRIGSSKREMSPDLLARQFQQRSQTRIIHFDEQPVTNAPIDVLEKALWRRFKTAFSANEDQEFLLKMGLIAKADTGELSPTVSGLLVATPNPELYIKNAFIQAVCYRGQERNAAYQVDAKDITGPIDQQINDACQFVYKNMKVSAKKEPHRIETPQYSMNAVFEAIVNAVAHRDYSIDGSKIRLHLFQDRIELFSPGAIPNTMDIASMSQKQFSRNETLTSLLARTPVMGEHINSERTFIMDKRGEGIPIILEASNLLSNRYPKYELIDSVELKLTIYAAESNQT